MPLEKCLIIVPAAEKGQRVPQVPHGKWQVSKSSANVPLGGSVSRCWAIPLHPIQLEIKIALAQISLTSLIETSFCLNPGKSIPTSLQRDQQTDTRRFCEKEHRHFEIPAPILELHLRGIRFVPYEESMIHQNRALGFQTTLNLRRCAKILSIFLTAIIPFSAGAATEPVGRFDYHKLKEVIHTSQVRSIEQLLPLLPADYLKSFTMMFKSNSIQEASPMLPRVIAFGADAKLVLAFNGHAQQKGFNDLEILSWNENESRLELHEILFDPKNQAAPRFSKTNPTECMQCHSTQGPSPLVKPLWNNYNIWTGAYGGYDDLVSLKAQDYGSAPAGQDFLAQTKTFFRFKESLRQNEASIRYKILFENKPAFYPYGPELKGSASLRPNMRLGNLLAGLMSRQLASVIQKSELYAVLKASITYECKAFFRSDF